MALRGSFRSRSIARHVGDHDPELHPPHPVTAADVTGTVYHLEFQSSNGFYVIAFDAAQAEVYGRLRLAAMASGAAHGPLTRCEPANEPDAREAYRLRLTALQGEAGTEIWQLRQDDWLRRAR